MTALGRWFRPPRHVLALFLGVTGSLSLAMGWLAWQLVAQDRALASQRRQERLDNAGETAVASLRKGLEDLAQRLELVSKLPAGAAPAALAEQASTLGRDAALILADGRAFDAWPAGILLYYPDSVLRRSTFGATPAFGDGEALEFERRDLGGALRAFQALTLSSDPQLRAGAWLRSARIWARLQKPDLARHAYDELAALGATPVEDLPAGLLARYGRCLLFKDVGRGLDVAREAAALGGELDAGTWRLTRAEYQFYRERVREWLPLASSIGPKSGTDERERLSAAIAATWDAWRDPRSVMPATGSRLVPVDGTPFLSVWQSGDRDLAVLSGGPRFIDTHFLQPANAALTRHRARVVLADETAAARSEEIVGGGRPVRRAAAETHLPWSVLIVDEDPGGELAAAVARNRILLAGLVALGLFVLAGSGFVVRAVNRELEVSRLQTDFVAAVSHEFRTPLTSIRQVSELLLDGRVPEARREDYYRMQHRDSDRLQRLVESLLDFGRMESGVHEYRLEPLDVAGLVREVAEEFGAEVAAAGYRVEAALPADRLLVSADREALGRAVWNLLDNAVKYSPSHKTVWVTVVLGDGGVAAISVRDRGVGVPVEDRRRIFDKFARGAGAAASGAKGTGLGLAMVQHIVKAHRGSVRVESIPAEGSTFTIALPALRIANPES